MKIASVRLPDSTTALAEVVGTDVQIIEGASGNDLLSVLTDPDSWTARGASVPIDTIRFLSPVPQPVSLRDYMAYEDHIKNSLNGLGQTVNPDWYRAPLCFFQNPNAIIGPEDAVRRPKDCTRLDYEVEIAAIIGREASDIDPDDPNALDCIAGFTLMNDWSARDLSAKEMRHFMGPVKGKDFATSLGPWVVTPDEFTSLKTGVIDQHVVARVNGKVTTDNNFSGMYFKWPQILAHASANTRLVPGDLLGSGTVGFGCLLELRTKNKELGSEVYTFLADGDVVEIETPMFGVLRNVIGLA